MSSEKFYIPKHLDDAPRFLLWSVDEAMSAIIPVFVGSILNLGFFTPIFALICYKSWKKIKGSGGQGFVRAVIYWYYPLSFLGVSILGLEATPDSAIKNYIA